MDKFAVSQAQPTNYVGSYYHADTASKVNWDLTNTAPGQENVFAMAITVNSKAVDIELDAANKQLRIDGQGNALDKSELSALRALLARVEADVGNHADPRESQVEC